MSDNGLKFTTGDWIVHRYHGIGQIKGTMVNDISGEETQYYELETADSIVWIPVEKMNSEILRPLSDPADIEEVKEVLQQPPNTMDSNFNKRKSRINKVQASSLPVPMARLIRDLRARQRKKGSLTNTEQRALRSLTTRLVREWSVSMGINTDRVQSQLNRLLHKSGKKAKKNGSGD
jgi:RNA polymerase-interacting CarD/CdnL/TRCF family regulator